MTRRLTMSDTWEGEAMPIYQIRLKEQLDQHWSAWFGGLMVTIKANGETLLTGEVVDQAALHRLLSKVHDLQLTLISVYSLMAVVIGGSSMLGLANIGPRAGLPVMEGKAAGARVVTTGRSDYPNQVNNTLVFLGLFRGAYKYRFFTPGRGHVPALGVFVVFDVPFPCAFSSCSQLNAWAVSGAR